MGANPGMVSLLVKQALLDLSGSAAPDTREGWSLLAERLGVRTIHVSEHDSQQIERAKETDEFINTWSVDGLVGERLQPAELGWGTHERQFPDDGGVQEEGCRAAIGLRRPGVATRVRSWAPLAGPLSRLSRDACRVDLHCRPLDCGRSSAAALPPDGALCVPAVRRRGVVAARTGRPQLEAARDQDHRTRQIVKGRDELGVLLKGHSNGRDWGYWCGSQLTIEQARALCPFNSATSLQVAAPIAAGMAWAIQNPQRGVVEPDDVPHAPLLEMIRPYLGQVVGIHTDWTPLQDRRTLFDEPLDRSDPWQFLNFRVL
jgi:homospermidine synthase